MKDIKNKILVEAKKYNVPLIVEIELLNQCNLNCIKCESSKIDGYLTYEVIVEQLHYLKMMGTLYVIFTGGEIFLRKDIFDIIKIARMLRFSVCIVTNGILLDETKVQKLKDLHVNSIYVRLLSLDERQYNSYTRTIGNLPIILNNIHLLKTYGVKVQIDLSNTKEDNLKNLTDVYIDSFGNVYKFSDSYSLLGNLCNNTITKILEKSIYL